MASAPNRSDDRLLCSFVTGLTHREKPLYGAQRGDKRPDGQYDVLCSYPATWQVEGRLACDRHLPAVARQAGLRGLVLLRLDFVPDRVPEIEESKEDRNV